MSSGDVDAASAPTVALMTLRLSPGSVFADRYEVLALLGEGGMGTVHRVLDRELREEIALKLLRPEIADAPGALGRFRREVKLARKVTHPNVARTYDLGAAAGARYLTMELIEGESVAKRWPLGKRAPLPEAMRIAAEVARGLSVAHAAGVVHRDLKPDNVMLADERVVITDFGIARQTSGHDLADASSTIGIVGTPAYMAPEQLEGRELDGRTDVYALGVVLYELLTGAPPFHGDTIYALAAARLSGEIPDPRARDAAIPEPLGKLVRDMLARNREDRPDAETTLARIDALRGGANAAIDRAPRLPSLEQVRSAMREPRAVAVLPLVSVDEAARDLAQELFEALGDAASAARGCKLVAVTKVAAAAKDDRDPLHVGRATGASFVLDGSVRVDGSRARVRLRLVDVDRATVGWADRIDGDPSEPFALEDAAVRAASEALGARTATDPARGGPTDPRVRGRWERARVALGHFALAGVREAAEICERALEEHPGDAWLMSLLGAALTRIWLQTGAADRELIARAEEVSLRALAIDPSIGETFHTIATLRLTSGDGRAAVRALGETLSRVPLHAEAHCDLGKLLCESGFVEEGTQRLDLALKLDPNLILAWFELSRTRALLGDRAGSEEAMARADAIGGAAAAIFPRVRNVFWWRDRDLAARVADVVERQQSGAAWEASVPILRAYADGQVHPSARDLFERLGNDARAAARHRAFMYALGAEYFGANDRHDDALFFLENAAELPLTDLLWIDRCPALDGVRHDPRFHKARALVASRAADLFR